jgi:hypothetical protein
MNNYTKDEIVDNYTVHGVPESLVKNMCKELKIDEKKFWKFMCGQTMGLVGGEGLIYPSDIKRFIRSLSNMD